MFIFQARSRKVVLSTKYLLTVAAPFPIGYGGFSQYQLQRPSRNSANALFTIHIYLLTLLQIDIGCIPFLARSSSQRGQTNSHLSQNHRSHTHNIHNHGALPISKHHHVIPPIIMHPRFLPPTNARLPGHNLILCFLHLKLLHTNRVPRLCLSMLLQPLRSIIRLLMRSSYADSVS